MIAGLVVLFSLSYYILLNGRYGVTLGRRLLNMKLVLLDRPNSDGIGYGRAAVRYLFFIIVGGFVRVAAFPRCRPPLALPSTPRRRHHFVAFDRREPLHASRQDHGHGHDPRSAGQVPGF